MKNNFLRNVYITSDNHQEVQSSTVSFNESAITGCLNDLVTVHNKIKSNDRFDASNVTVTYSKDILAALFSGNLFEAITSDAELINDFEFVYTNNDVYKYVDNETHKTYYVTIYPDSYCIVPENEACVTEDNPKNDNSISYDKPKVEMVDRRDADTNLNDNNENNDSPMSLKNIIMNDIAKYNESITEEFDITPYIDYVSQCVIYGNYEFVTFDKANEEMRFIDPSSERETNEDIIGVAITTDNMEFFDHRDEIENHLCSNELFDFSSADIVAGDDNNVYIILYV